MRTAASVWLLSSWLAVLGPASAVSGQEQAQITRDPDTGLVMDGPWRLVGAHCGACHSTRLVTQNRGSRQHWLGLIRWMQETQGLWPLNAETEEQILDYLVQWYGPVPTGRRMPLPEHLLPAYNID